MNEHIIKEAGNWFNNIEQWESFLELVQAKDAITEEWLIEATDKLRKKWAQSLNLGWQIMTWENSRDTWWFLDKFGPASVGIGFGWHYVWCFGAIGGQNDIATIDKEIAREEYAPLHQAFGPVDERYYDHNILLSQERLFDFDSTGKQNTPRDILAWHAGHRPDVFIKQALEKVYAFTASPEVTKLMTQLNES